MNSPDPKVFVFGRLRGVTTRRIGKLARAVRIGPDPPAGGGRFDRACPRHGPRRGVGTGRASPALSAQEQTPNYCPSDPSNPGSGRLCRRSLPTLATPRNRWRSSQGSASSRSGLSRFMTFCFPSDDGLSYTDLVVARAVGTPAVGRRDVSQDHRRCARARTAGDEPVGGPACGSSLGRTRSGARRRAGAD